MSDEKSKIVRYNYKTKFGMLLKFQGNVRRLLMNFP